MASKIKNILSNYNFFLYCRVFLCNQNTSFKDFAEYISKDIFCTIYKKNNLITWIVMNQLLNLYPRPRFVSTSLLSLTCVIKFVVISIISFSFYSVSILTSNHLVCNTTKLFTVILQILLNIKYCLIPWSLFISLWSSSSSSSSIPYDEL